jgi:hypothetical protein
MQFRFDAYAGYVVIMEQLVQDLGATEISLEKEDATTAVDEALTCSTFLKYEPSGLWSNKKFEHDLASLAPYFAKVSLLGSDDVRYRTDLAMNRIDNARVYISSWLSQLLLSALEKAPIVAQTMDKARQGIGGLKSAAEDVRSAMEYDLKHPQAPKPNPTILPGGGTLRVASDLRFTLGSRIVSACARKGVTIR